MRWHRDSQFALEQFRFCIAKKKSNGCRVLGRRVFQRNAKFPRPVGVIERDDHAFFLRFTKKNIGGFVGSQMP